MGYLHSGTAHHHHSVLLSPKDPSSFSFKTPAPLSETYHCRLKLIITHLLCQGLLIPTDLPCNTSILPVHGPSSAYRLLQDLRHSNLLCGYQPLHLSSNIPPTNSHVTILDLFLTLPLHPDSYFLFACTRKGSDTRAARQLTPTVLPQGFQDSPHFLSQALAQDLSSLDLNASILLQYVDDLLLHSPSLSLSQMANSFLPLGSSSPSTAKLCSPTLIYLGIQLSRGS